MAKVAIATIERAESRDGATRALFDRKTDPIHVHVHVLAAHSCLELDARPVDRVAYVWKGDATVGDTPLAKGSSMIVERNGRGALTAGGGGAEIIVFAASSPPESARDGGKTHVLPAQDVPRFETENGLVGALHANGGCQTCSVWLHENSFPPVAQASAQAAEAGIHCHSESEVIFVAAGQVRLGQKLYGPGTAIAIAADTMYSFTPGPEGLHFLNFRAEQPTDIRFKNGNVIDEVGYWRDRVPTPGYR